MYYEAELRFLRDTFKKCRIQTGIVSLDAPLDDWQDIGLHLVLTSMIDSAKPLCNAIPTVKPATIYRLNEPFTCRYMYLLLPELPRNAILLIGPYLPAPLTQQQIMEWGERNGISPSQQKQLESYYGSVPIVPETSHLFMLLDAFGERLWGANGFTMEDITRGSFGAVSPLSKKKSSSEEKDTLWNMENMELRYSYENALMDAVSKGQTHKADMLLSGFSTFSFEQRLSDPVRDAQNYFIIMNTLLRKAAEKGGVHPLYLDSTSSFYAVKIGQLSSLDTTTALMSEMLHAYCRLVRKHSMKNYSAPVQKAITCIDADLAGNLSLRSLSQMLNVSSSYLSTLFKKETGQTLTEYINCRRVSHARHLLETTRLQVQTIAQHCGIMDVHYFSKVFKKITGQTPKEYRGSISR